MRPYFAIIKDSFRAAWASKVLYVLLGLITLLLIGLAPLHYRESLDWKLIPSDYIRESGSISQRLFDKKDAVDEPLMGKIWQVLPNGLRDDLTSTFAQPNSKGSNPNKRNMAMFNELIGELNNVIAEPDFFAGADPTDLSELGLDEQIAAARQNKDDVDSQRRLNRLIISRMFSPLIEAGDTSSMTAYYGPWRLGFLDALSANKGQFASGIAAYIPGILDKFVLSIGLAIAIVVTASIIPETFEPGSLNLLLSKPVSRWGLYVAKFVGGCVFISICATYLFAGIWLWLGLALGVWENAILLSILLYIIVFGIYFSVSAFVGLVFRSTILAIMVTLLFWSACFLVGTSYGFLDTKLQNNRIVKLAESEDALIALDRMSQLTSWQPRSKQWGSSYPNDDGQNDRRQVGAVSWLGDLEEFPLPFGPLVNPDDQRLVAGRTSMSNMLSFGQQELLASSPGGRTMQNKGNFPRGTVDFLKGANDLIAVTGEGKFFRFGQKTKRAVNDKTATIKRSNKLFTPLGPDKPTPVISRGVSAINQHTNEIAVYGNRVVSVFRLGEEGYVLDRSIEVETDAPDSMSCQLAFEGDTMMLALGNGQIITLRGGTLEELFGYRPDINHAIEDVVALPGGRWFFVLYRQGTVRMLDTQNPKAMTLAPFSGQGNISAVCVSTTGQLLIADRGNRVTRYRAEDFQPIETMRPADGRIEQIYYWGIQPLYSIWPKPGEFYKVVAWFADGDDGVAANEIDLRLKPRYRNPWAPLTSGLAFMSVMIGLSCLYFWRKDY
jgi:ABC-type transport system involved in multi-copper enzyme maturation permease subunit